MDLPLSFVLLDPLSTVGRVKRLVLNLRGKFARKETNRLSRPANR